MKHQEICNVSLLLLNANQREKAGIGLFVEPRNKQDASKLRESYFCLPELTAQVQEPCLSYYIDEMSDTEML